VKDIVALIPARSGSKGVPNKNILELCGIPLLAYSIAAAKNSELIDRIIVSTDSKEYADVARKYGAEVPFLRPPEISGDNSTDLQFFDHAINWLKKNESFEPEFFAHLRPTTPIRNPKVLDDALRSFINGEYTALRSCHKMSESSYKTFEIEDNKLKCLFNGGFDVESSNRNRQTYPNTFDSNGYIDVIRSSLVKNHGLIHGDKVQAFVTERAYEVDEITDIDLLEYMMIKREGYIESLFQ
jgi:CMP-N,N'-diacetyllegionaminic acid synthase